MGEGKAIELRYDDAGELDEVCASDATVHLERMDDDVWSLILEKPGQRVALTIHRQRREVRVFVFEHDGPCPECRGETMHKMSCESRGSGSG